MRHLRSIILGLLVLLATGVLSLSDPETFLAVTGYPTYGHMTGGNTFVFPPSGTFEIALNPPEEFDGRTRKELFKKREVAFSLYPTLFKGEFRSDGLPFQEIADDRPWWGIQGLYRYGVGEKSILGESEESRFFLNPLLLLGLTEAVVPAYRSRHKKGKLAYLFPQSLRVESEDKRMMIGYSLSNLNREDPGLPIQLVTYNAQDAGFHWLAFDTQSLKGVSLKKSSSLVLLKQFVHTGSSCGYPGGCQNMSPGQEELVFKIDSLPATIRMKLWRRKPSAPEKKEDLLVEFTLY